MMWLLLIIFFGTEIQTQQELYRYDTIQECQKERDRLGYIMAESYPNEANFTIECHFEKRATHDS